MGEKLYSTYAKSRYVFVPKYKSMCRDQIRRSHKLTHKEHLDIYFDEVFKTKYEHVIIRLLNSARFYTLVAVMFFMTVTS